MTANLSGLVRLRTSTRQKAARREVTLKQFNAAEGAGAWPAACTSGSGINYNDACPDALGENYLCHIGAENYRIRRGSVGLLITSTQSSKTAGCSGTLVNNQRSDDKNYILTAEHCAQSSYDYSQNTVTAYWDRINSCGEAQQSCLSQPGPGSNGYVTVHALQRTKDANDRQESDADSWLLSSPAAISGGASPLWQAVDARDTSTANGIPQGAQDPSFRSVVVVGNGQAKTKKYLANSAAVRNGDSNAFGGAVSRVTRFIDEPTASAPMLAVCRAQGFLIRTAI